ncbi:hypothetical protein GCAAIG_03480 [Candidatus Electronema halotolerans]|jgi:twitching motility two-component system response regulator PilH
METICNIPREYDFLRFSKQFWKRKVEEFSSAELSVSDSERWQQDARLYDGQAKRILIVDDSPTERSLLEKFLSKFGYQVIIATDGEAGVARALSEQPDLIILDVVMPNMNGFEACRTIKSTPELAQIPVFLLTSKNGKSDEFWGKKQGADLYMTKPFDPDEMLKAVFRYISKHLLFRYEREARRRQRKEIAGLVMRS